MNTDLEVEECSDGLVRLVDGQTETEGRVKVCQGGVWGTICDDHWTQEDTDVVCRQLGFLSSGIIAITNFLHCGKSIYICSSIHSILFILVALLYAGKIYTFYGEGKGPILLNNVKCLGIEYGVLECVYDHNTADCSHSDDVGVMCHSCKSAIHSNW